MEIRPRPLFTGLFWTTRRNAFSNLKMIPDLKAWFYFKDTVKTKIVSKGIVARVFHFAVGQPRTFSAIFCHFQPCFWHEEDIRLAMNDISPIRFDKSCSIWIGRDVERLMCVGSCDNTQTCYAAEQNRPFLSVGKRPFNVAI